MSPVGQANATIATVTPGSGVDRPWPNGRQSRYAQSGRILADNPGIENLEVSYENVIVGLFGKCTNRDAFDQPSNAQTVSNTGKPRLESGDRVSVTTRLAPDSTAAS